MLIYLAYIFLGDVGTADVLTISIYWSLDTIDTADTTDSIYTGYWTQTADMLTILRDF